jgi:nucleotide-binding universal stress UspA family protein
VASERGPVVIAYDGSDLSRAAVRHAADLFPGRPTVLATVWEPGLAVIPSGASDALGSEIPLDPETIEMVDRAEQEHASRVANAGAELARSLGLEAEPHPVPDAVDVGDTLIDLARDRSAAAIVVGSHGRSALRAAMLGSVSHKLVAHSDRPVVVIRGERS